MSLTLVDCQSVKADDLAKIIKQNYLTQLGINPRKPMSTTFSPSDGSNFPSTITSCHSKLLLMDSESVIVISLVSFPVITKLLANLPVTTQEPGGIEEVADKGFGTVVAPDGA